MIDQEKKSSEPANSKNKIGRPKSNRRSLFSVLFQTSNKSASKMEEDEENVNNNNNSIESKEEEEIKIFNDADSYVLDLNDQMAQEKFKQQDQKSPANKLSARKQDDLLEPSQRRRKSPMLEEFCQKHKLQFNSSSTESDSDSCASIALVEGEGANLKRSLFKRRTSSSDRDLRLINWRLLAAKSMWSASSLPSSDSEMDQLNSESPALVITCSDDTSCSSVELIWSRGNEDQERLRKLAQGHSAKTKEISQSATNTPSPSPLPNNFYNALPRRTGQERILQRLSIFELAKPSRAKGKRFAPKSKEKETKLGADNSQLWVANPLFTKEPVEEEAKLSEKNLRSRISSISSSITSSSSDPIEVGIEEDDEDVNFSDTTSNGRINKESKKRWSMRGKSPFNGKRDNIYLNHIINLDKRIKTNVSSIKSQISVKLSDTSKRASVLADSLITSIKDTTREQLNFNGKLIKRGDSEKISTNTMPKNSFSSSPSVNDLTFSGGDKKAKLFSLIYKHQQQANGQPVITKQPQPSSALLGFTGTQNKVSVATMTSPQPEEEEVRRESVESSSSELFSLEENIAKEDELKGEEVEEVQQQQQQEEYQTAISATTTSQSSSNNLSKNNQVDGFHQVNSRESNSFVPGTPDASDKLKANMRRRKKRKQRRQANVAPPSDDEDGEFYHKEYAKLRSTLDNNDDTARRLAYSQLRSLNYWTRFRLRKLGIDWKLTPVRRSLSMDF